ncbi:hypothetical protein RJ640_000790 [Escallonia rubra]|uniref:RING-type E3 ubiquitin transferase n=1 Tax=Escallonia rubra TaxID=112253 RepID=A0AA88QJ06_9ASTE|nr:hypothetical protein RJ640_000790 [Escallonia rubra]
MSAGAAVAVFPQQYFCHQCNRTVTITPVPSAELLCPSCNGGFLEEWVNHNPNPSPDLDPFTSILSSLLSRRRPSRNHRAVVGTPGWAPGPEPGHAAFDPFVFLESYIGSLRDGGANIDFMIDDHSTGGGRGGGDFGGFMSFPANFGDYFMGPGLEQLIQQLAENDPNRYGTPPAAKSVVESLPSVAVDDKLLSSDLAQCAVCKDDFERGMEVKQMPCNHVYHPGCILPWLELHNSCPVCRHELPTDDLDYENRLRETQGNLSGSGAGSGGGGGEGGSGRNVTRMTERTFTISLPRSFWEGSGYGSARGYGGFGPAGGSSSGGNNDGPSNLGDID